MPSPSPKAQRGSFAWVIRELNLDERRQQRNGHHGVAHVVQAAEQQGCRQRVLALQSMDRDVRAEGLGEILVADQQALRLIEDAGHTPETVLPAGEVFYLRSTGNQAPLSLFENPHEERHIGTLLEAATRRYGRGSIGLGHGGAGSGNGDGDEGKREDSIHAYRLAHATCTCMNSRG